MCFKMLFCQRNNILQQYAIWKKKLTMAWNVDTSGIRNKTCFVLLNEIHNIIFRWNRYWQWDITGNWRDAGEHSEVFVKKNVLVYGIKYIYDIYDVSLYLILVFGCTINFILCMVYKENINKHKTLKVTDL